MIDFVAILALAAAPAVDAAHVQNDPQPEVSKPAKPAKDSPDYIRCRRLLITGSNIRRKVCQTNAAWDRMADKGQQAVKEIFDNAANGHTNQNTVPE